MVAASEPGSLVIAHRGASAQRPEHTLEAYAVAIEQGADFIEPDLVATADGVLIARHENELSGTTDVALRTEFATRKTTKRVDGVEVTGWFSEDFTLAEIKRLRARERIPDVRPANARYDGRFEIPTLTEIIELAQGAEYAVGIYPETKHPTYFAEVGKRLDGSPIGISLGARLVQTLVDAKFVDPKRVYIQSFEIANLRELAHVLMPAAGVDFPLIQLIGDLSSSPYDLVYATKVGALSSRRYGPLTLRLNIDTKPATYRDLLDGATLKIAADDYVHGLGPSKNDVLPTRGLPPRWTGTVAPFVKRARVLGLEVHVYTLRPETVFIPQTRDGKPQTMRDEIAALERAGATGYFTDAVDLARRAN